METSTGPAKEAVDDVLSVLSSAIDKIAWGLLAWFFCGKTFLMFYKKYRFINHLIFFRFFVGMGGKCLRKMAKSCPCS